MKTIYNDISLVKNEKRSRFEIVINGKYTFANYAEYGAEIALIHTQTHPELAGQGVASALVEKTLYYLEKNSLQLLPYCPFVWAYIKKHPEWKRIVSKKFKGYDKL